MPDRLAMDGLVVNAPKRTPNAQRPTSNAQSLRDPFVMSSESLALSEVEWVETSLTVSCLTSGTEITMRDSSPPLGMTKDMRDQLTDAFLIRGFIGRSTRR
jgi:hypothetical protein